MFFLQCFILLQTIFSGLIFSGTDIPVTGLCFSTRLFASHIIDMQRNIVIYIQQFIFSFLVRLYHFRFISPAISSRVCFVPPQLAIITFTYSISNYNTRFHRPLHSINWLNDEYNLIKYVILWRMSR